MMIHLKLFIPLSMLTTLLISHICYNDNLKFKKIPFRYAAGKYALDYAHFPVEESLSDAEFMQMHKHWLTLLRFPQSLASMAVGRHTMTGCLTTLIF